MKFKLLKILLLLPLFVFGQLFEKIKNLDTIYIKYEKSNLTLRIIEAKNKEGFNNRLYNFTCLINNKKSKDVFVIYRKYKNSEDRKLNKPAEIKTVNKKFIKNHENSIIGSTFFSRFESCELDNNILNDKKVYYIIDTFETNKGKIFLYEVIAGVFCNNED